MIIIIWKMTTFNTWTNAKKAKLDNPSLVKLAHNSSEREFVRGMEGGRRTVCVGTLNARTSVFNIRGLRQVNGITL